MHGSRDYFQIKEKGFTFEVVPILKIKDAKEAMNITDVSPLHAAWVKKHKKFADDIALQFNTSVKTAKRDIVDLKVKGKIRFCGSKKTGYYVLVEQS